MGASAATEKDMDQARAIAAKYYMRYSNNQSDYLDKIEPQSMLELEGSIKDADRAHFNEVKNVKVPGDYANWNKDQFVTYWKTQFFQANSNQFSNKEAALNQEAMGKRTADVRKISVTETAAEAPQQPQPDPEKIEEISDLIQQKQNDLQEMQDMDKQAEEDFARDSAQTAADSEKSEGSGTWVYVMILCILVAVVIGLVVYASRTMKKSPSSSDRRGGERQRSETRREEVRERREEPQTVNAEPQPTDDRMREKYAEALAERSAEISALNRKIGELSAKVAELNVENDRLRTSLRDKDYQLHLQQQQLQKAQQQLAQQPAAAPQDDEAVVASVYKAPRPEQPRTEPVEEPKETISPASRPMATVDEAPEEKPAEKEDPDMRVIYLGRVNSRGIFVRADKQIKPGLSIYKLSTNNGLTGTFSVVNDMSVVNVAFDDPGRWLAAGCTAKDIFDTDGKGEIITETPGTAVFEEGAWRLLRKARIKYE